jgi:ubiquinone/menaquinone biosynthesis C-methylase UbiE
VSGTTSTSFLVTNGDGYHLQMGRWSQRLAPLFVEFAGVDQGRRVLDVGCGTGILSVCLASNPSIGNISGVDVSAIYIEHANKNKTSSRLHFQIGDACNLGFPDAWFDHSLSLLALQFTADVNRAVGEMRRVTQSGGTVAAATWDTRGGFVAFRMVMDAAAMLGQHGKDQRALAYTRPLSRPGELAQAWRDAGLINVSQDMRTIRMDFTTFSDFWISAEGGEGPIAAFVRSLDPAAHANLRDAVRLAYLDGEADGPRSYAATAWVARGEVP